MKKYQGGNLWKGRKKLSIILPEDQKGEIEAIAKEFNTTISESMRMIIAWGIDSYQKC